MTPSRVSRTTTRLLCVTAALTMVFAAASCESDGGSPGTPDGFVSGADVGPQAYNERRDLSALFDVPGVDAQTNPPEGYIPTGATDLQIEALRRVNWYRWKAGLPVVDLDNAISEAAQKHCECYVAHSGEWTISPHSENPSWGEPCRGESMIERIDAAGGSTGAGASEVIAFETTPTRAVDGWMDTLYHRVPILDPSARFCGYGEVIEGLSKTINTMDFVVGDTVADREGIHLYPYDGQTDVPTSWNGYESPQPPEPPNGYPSGPIVTLTLGKGGWMGETHELFNEVGDPVEHTYLDQYNDDHLQGWNTVAIYANEPLDPDATYQVHIRINDSGAPRSIRWSFTTR